METSIIKIGNSQGIIIPKKLISKIGAKEKVDLQVRDGGLFIAPINDAPRKGWEEAFAQASIEDEPEEDFFEGLDNSFDNEEWTW